MRLSPSTARLLASPRSRSGRRDTMTRRYLPAPTKPR